MNLGLFGERLASDRLSHDFRFHFLPHSERAASPLGSLPVNTTRVNTRLEHVVGTELPVKRNTAAQHVAVGIVERGLLPLPHASYV